MWSRLFGRPGAQPSSTTQAGTSPRRRQGPGLSQSEPARPQKPPLSAAALETLQRLEAEALQVLTRSEMPSSIGLYAWRNTDGQVVRCPDEAGSAEGRWALLEQYPRTQGWRLGALSSLIRARTQTAGASVTAALVLERVADCRRIVLAPVDEGAAAGVEAALSLSAEWVALRGLLEESRPPAASSLKFVKPVRKSGKPRAASPQRTSSR